LLPQTPPSNIGLQEKCTATQTLVDARTLLFSENPQFVIFRGLTVRDIQIAFKVRDIEIALTVGGF